MRMRSLQTVLDGLAILTRLEPALMSDIMDATEPEGGVGICIIEAALSTKPKNEGVGIRVIDSTLSARLEGHF
jgi:hypothetical protein